jgi:hypothetical protein
MPPVAAVVPAAQFVQAPPLGSRVQGAPPVDDPANAGTAVWAGRNPAAVPDNFIQGSAGQGSQQEMAQSIPVKAFFLK